MILKAVKFPDNYIDWIWLCMSTTSFFINLTGNFKATRGLRQRDLFSSCLFILIMEGSIQLLKWKILNSLRYPKCEHINLFSLITDELFILSKTDSPSVMVIKDALVELHTLLGLEPNLLKCEVFISRISLLEKKVITDILGMILGNLSIRYLGVPLIFGKLSYSDCGRLLDRLSTRV